MRWLAIPLAIAFGWFAFTLSPLWSLYDLAQAVRARDAAYVAGHVNFRTLRLSLVQQITAAVKRAAEADESLEPRERQRLNEAAQGLALAFAESLVTPETVIDLLDDGWPQRLDIARPAGETADEMAGGLRIDRLGRLVPYYLAAEMRGFRTVVIAVPPQAPRAQQTRIRLKLRGLTWRLVEIELNESLRAQMAQRLGRLLAKARSGERSPAALP